MSAPVWFDAMFNKFLFRTARSRMKTNQCFSVCQTAVFCSLMLMMAGHAAAFDQPEGLFSDNQRKQISADRKQFTREDLLRMRMEVHGSPERALTAAERVFLDAAATADVDALRKSLAADVNIHVRALGGDTALMLAVRAGHLEVVRELLSRGAWPSGKAVDGFTPLATAARRGHAPIARELLRAGARTEERTDSRETALTLAVLFGHQAVVRELMMHGADPSVQSGSKPVHEGQPPLVMAAVLDQAGIVKVLLGYGADPNIRDGDRQTPLQWALLRGNREIAEALLTGGSDPELLPIGLCMFYFEPKLSKCR